MESGKLEKIYLAAYGTLRRGYSNSRLVDRGDNWIGTGKTVDKYEMRASGIPFVNKTPSTQIVVDLWEINKDELKDCDGLEGHPRWYRREMIDVNVKNNTYKAWLYFNNTSNGTIVTSGDFKSK